jgi:hypothetical protein
MIEAHYEREWGLGGIPCLFSAGPTDELPQDFAVLKFPPRTARNMWTYATRCMAQPSDAAGMELHIFSPYDTIEIVELLYAVAHFHRTGAELALGQTVNFGRPWVSGSSCSFGLISLPYLDGPDLENLTTSGNTVKFYWLLPVTSSEVVFKKRQGLAALERKFEECSINYLDPNRRSAV